MEGEPGKNAQIFYMQDMIGVYSHFLEHQSDIESGNYNAGFENISILEIAEMIVKKVPC